MSSSNLAIPSGPLARRVSRSVLVAHGARQVWVGGDAPVVVQSMTNTDTADVIGTAIQIKELARAGSELVRITVDKPEAAAAVPLIREQLDKMEIDVPLVGDFHYNGHTLLRDYPGVRARLVEVPHQSGQRRAGRQARQPVRPDDRSGRAVRQAGAHRRQLGSASTSRCWRASWTKTPPRAQPWSAQAVMYEALITSAIDNADARRRTGPGARQDHPVVQGVGRAGPDRRVPRTGAPLRLSAAPRPDRSGHGQQGHRRLDRGAVGAAAGRHRRHHPHFADARSRAATAPRK